jgi:hypothetical protein
MSNEQNNNNNKSTASMASSPTKINSSNPKALKKQLTYSCGMKLDNVDDKFNEKSNKLHRCQEVENLTEKQELETEMENQDSDALHSKTHLKRTCEFENLNEINND